MSKITSADDQQRRTLLIVLILNALLFLGLGVGVQRPAGGFGRRVVGQ